MVGWFVLLPSDFQDLEKSVFAQAFFAGNFYYWLSAGYFDQPAIYKPLLHTWSLAVEEQYYLFFPILFLPWWRSKIFALCWVIGLAAFGSMVLSACLTESAPNAAFYLLHSRAWELLGGALLAITPFKPKVSRFVREAIGWCGFLAIAFAMMRYTAETPFPGLAAVLPCAGVMAIIWSNGLEKQTTSLARLLSFRAFVFIGKISYSLYLWHWPILVYATYWQEYGILPWYIRGALLALSFILAVVSWKYVETPFRTRAVLPQRRAIFAFGLLGPTACALFGVVLVLSDGMPSRFTKAIVVCDAARAEKKMPQSDLSHADILQSAQKGDFIRLGLVDKPVQCLLWGDSHAFAVSPALAEMAARFSTSIEIATYSATCPILDYENRGKNSLGPDAARWSEAIIEHVRGQKIKNVLLVAHWELYLEEIGSTPEMAEKLKATTITLQEAGARVWIMKDVPLQSVDVPKAMAKAMLNGKSLNLGITKEEYLVTSHIEDDVLAPSASRGANILDPAPSFFLNRPNSLIMISGSPLYSDHEHLTGLGASLIADLFRPIWAK